MIIIYTDEQLKIIEEYKCKRKCCFANGRFKDKLIPYDLLKSLERHRFKCFYCGDKLNPKTWQLDHFHSRAMGGLNTPDNLCPSCKWCNFMKNALDGNAFIHKCKKIAVNNFFTVNKLELHPENKEKKLKDLEFKNN